MKQELSKSDNHYRSHLNGLKQWVEIEKNKEVARSARAINLKELGVSSYSESLIQQLRDQDWVSDNAGKSHYVTGLDPFFVRELQANHICSLLVKSLIFQENFENLNLNSIFFEGSKIMASDFGQPSSYAAWIKSEDLLLLKKLKLPSKSQGA